MNIIDVTLPQTNIDSENKQVLVENIIFQPHCQGRHDNLLEGDWEPKSCNESLGQPEFLTIYPHFFGAYLIPVTLVGKSPWGYNFPVSNQLLSGMILQVLPDDGDI